MRSALLDSDLGVRHYWLLWAGSAQIQNVADLFEDWVLVTAFLHLGPESLVGGRHSSPQRRALALLRRGGARAASRHTLDDCMQGIRGALHPQLRLVWMVLLVENYPHLAPRELMRLLAPTQEQELRSACAFGLSLLGRPVLLEIRERFRDAPVSIREFLCRSMWHLGPLARGCEAWLEGYDSDWSRAVLYRLEAFGWRVLLRRRAWPLWIDRESLAALAQLAFSLQPADQSYALRALLGWGPEFAQVEPLLTALGQDIHQVLAEPARLAAIQLGWREGIPPNNQELTARLSFGNEEESLKRQREMLDSFHTMGVEQQLICLEDLALNGLPDQQSATLVWEIMLYPDTTPWRISALKAYLAVGRKPRPHPALHDSSLSQAAADHMVQISGPAEMLAHLDNPKVQRALAQPPHLLRALVEWPPDLFQKLENRLHQLGLGRFLQQLDLNGIHWRGFDQFTAVQYQVAAALIQRHEKLPEELVEAVLQGIVHSPALLEFWVAYAPKSALSLGLAYMLLRSADDERPRLRLALHQQGASGKRVLRELLGQENPSLAREAALELKRWP